MIKKEEKNKGGRPPFFKSEEELQKKVDEYFEKGYRKKKVASALGIEVEYPAITTTDLALFLGFESRQSIYDYANKSQFSYIIKRALFFIEREYEEKLMFSQNTSGAIFALKNMGWKDKSEVDQNISGELKTTTTVDKLNNLLNND